MKFVKLMFVTLSLIMSAAPLVHAAQASQQAGAKSVGGCIPTSWGCIDPSDPAYRP